MDLDAYVLAHHADWARLEALLGRRRLTGDESDELVERYQQVATHLSVLRTAAPDPTLVAHLSSLLARARNRSVGTRVSTWRGVAPVLHRPLPGRALPAAVSGGWARWPPTSWSTAVMMWWLLDHPNVEQSLLSPGEVDQLVNHDFEGYYSEYAASHFAAQVWINNAWVTALCLGLGILGLPLVKVLFDNIANLAIIGSIMTRHDRGELFWGLILPHGLLELTAVFVAGGVGLRLFWSWVEPGDLSRAQSLAREGRTAGTVALGLVAVLLVSGVIEAFVTPLGPAHLGPDRHRRPGRGGFLAYVFVLGRAAYLRGQTGDIDASLLEDRVATQG